MKTKTEVKLMYIPLTILVSGFFKPLRDKNQVTKNPLTKMARGIDYAWVFSEVLLYFISY